jgi:hypothetical protein
MGIPIEGRFVLNRIGLRHFCALTTIIIFMTLSLAMSASAQGSFSTGDSELENWIVEPKLRFDEWLDDQRPSLEIAFDLSMRIVEKSGGSGTGHVNWVGIDLIDQLHWDGFPIATILVQAYAVEVKDLPATPIIFDDSRDWQLQWRFVYLDFDRWSHKGISWKVGHFQVPFGLEWTSDTTGTLRQYTNAKNLGVKADWGMSAHGTVDGLDYEVAVTRGSGNEYRDVSDNHLFAVRIGASPGHNLSYGVSYFDAQLTGQDAPIGMSTFPKPDRVRYGVDARWNFPGFQLLGECSRGTNDDLDVWSALLEANIHGPDERNLAYLQTVGSATKGVSDWDERVQAHLGVKRLIGPSLSLEAQWTHDLELPGNAPLGDTGVLQIRYRF